jgi:hypothetical protein
MFSGVAQCSPVTIRFSTGLPSNLHFPGIRHGAAGRLFDVFTSCLDEGRRMGRANGPLAGDFHVALELDWLVREYVCDALIETGTFEGDSTGYLALAYPDLPVWTCENDGGGPAPRRGRFRGCSH